MDYVVPDAVGEPVYGWRTWFVIPWEEDGLRLRSFVYSFTWEPREPLHAYCKALRGKPWSREGSHEAPNEGCDCGIYALSDPEGVDRYYRDGSKTTGTFTREVYRARGLVALWGKVVPAEKGTRAEYAYPVRIELPAIIKGREQLLSVKEIALNLESYGAEIEIVDDMLDLR